MSTRYRYGRVYVDVDVDLDDVIDALTDQEKADLRDDLIKEIGAPGVAPANEDDLTRAIRQRHDTAHDLGPMWLCDDAICRAKSGDPR